MAVKYSKRYDLPDVYKNDSVNSFKLTFTDELGNVEDMTGAEITMTFTNNGKVYRTLSVGDGISINMGEVTFSIQPFTMHGVFSYDIQFVRNGIKRTYLYGKINVNNDITKG